MSEGVGIVKSGGTVVFWDEAADIMEYRHYLQNHRKATNLNN